MFRPNLVLNSNDKASQNFHNYSPCTASTVNLYLYNNYIRLVISSSYENWFIASSIPLIPEVFTQAYNSLQKALLPFWNSWVSTNGT